MNKIERLLNMVDSDMLLSMVQEVNSWDSSLEHMEFFSIAEIDDILAGFSPSEIIDRVYHGEFNPYDDYFQFNAYANLISYSEWEMQAELEGYKEEIVERFMELYEDGHVDTWDEEIRAILDSEEEEEEEEEA